MPSDPLHAVEGAAVAAREGRRRTLSPPRRSGEARVRPPEPTSPTGRRRITERMLAARATRPAAWEPAKRGHALSALKRAAPALGIPGRVIELLDYLVGCTRAADWAAGTRPVAFPSNAALQDALGLGRTQIKTLIRVAAEYDLLEPDDGPNGRRYGSREGRDGPIVEAYGFDLTPLAARRAELEAVAAAHQERRREGGRLRARITATRNKVLMLTDAALMRGLSGADWPALADAARRLFDLRGDSFDPAWLGPVAGRLASLLELVREHVATADAPESVPVGIVDTDPKGPEKRPSITPTTHLGIVETTAAPVGPDRPRAQGGGGSRGHSDPRDAASGTGASDGASRGRPGTPGSPESALRGFVVTPDLLLRMAPAFRDWLTTPRPTWSDLAEAAGFIRAELGISPHAWGQACVVLGRQEAVTVLGVISTRTAAGEVRSPNGYLRRMVELHREGGLRLDKTLFGLADGLSRPDRSGACPDPTAGGKSRTGPVQESDRGGSVGRNGRRI